jgi:predicted AlkP superfamily pyrophosphatase or phosphodiesterase
VQADTTYVLFSVDGMRPDGMLQADTPEMDRLIEQGALSLTAQTVMPSVTLPCHTSMLRGVDPTRHGITTNTFQPLARPVPSLIDVARAAGKRTGAFYNWGELRDLYDPGGVDAAYFWHWSETQEGDWRVANAAADHVRDRPFDLIFIYMGHTDDAGHQSGWMSRPYLDAISNADRCLTHVLNAVRESGRRPVVHVTSDHGGHERAHGTDCPEDMTIPWLLSGPGIRQGISLEGDVRIRDTCVTLAHLLGLPSHRSWDGRAVEEALDPEKVLTPHNVCK